MSRTARLEASIVASALLHALVLGVALRGERVTLRPPLVAIPVALVAGAGGGGGAAGPTTEAAAPRPEPAAAPALPPAAPPRAKPRPRPAAVARRSPATPVPPAESAATAGGGQGSGVETARGGDGGGGDGSGGDGSGGAHAGYGTNPLPPYPLAARRLGKEGVVLLEVLVEPDGHAADVRVVRSSGFAPLDDSAATTVRERWRFVPARRDGAPVESRVTVPIRFRLAGEPEG